MEQLEEYYLTKKTSPPPDALPPREMKEKNPKTRIVINNECSMFMYALVYTHMFIDIKFITRAGSYQRFNYLSIYII